MTSYTFHVEDGKIDQHGITFCPDFVTISLSDVEAMQLIEQLAYKLSHKQSISVCKRGVLRSTPPDPLRCPVCGWPMTQFDCTAGACAAPLAKKEQSHV